MILTPTIRYALKVSATAHKNQNRKGSVTPYIVHPVGVMLILADHTNDESTLAAALLHDVLEDCPNVYSEEKMREDFGDVITDTVKSVTKDATIKDWRSRNEKYLETLKSSNNGKAILVCVADKINNLIDILEDYEVQSGDAWLKFNAGKEEQLWWYSSVYDLIYSIIPDHPLTKNLNYLLEKLAIIVND